MKRKIKTTRRARIPNGHIRIELTLPAITVKRITKHCKANNLDEAVFLRTAIYAKLPVHYEVDEQFILPFGKYTGETAEAVSKMEPTYLEWCQKNIKGFDITGKLLDTISTPQKVSKPSSKTTGKIVQSHQLSEFIRHNELLHINSKSAWAVHKECYIAGRGLGNPRYEEGLWRKLASRIEPTGYLYTLV